MVPSWLNCPKDLPEGRGTRVGVAIGVSSVRHRQLHLGILHSQNYPPKVLHLEWHHATKDDPLPHQWIPFWWVPIDLPPLRAEAVAGHCRRIWKRVEEEGLRIPYGLVYKGGKFSAQGRTQLAVGEIGLTCATFVLAVLATAGLKLLDLPTWEERDATRIAEDNAWHAGIVALMKATRADYEISDGHIAGVEQERGCSRFRPEEVAGACGLPGKSPSKHKFDEVRPLGALIRAVLLPEPPG